MNGNKRVLLLIALPCVLRLGLVAVPQRVVSTTPVGPVWEMERAHLGVSVGEGVALRSDGRAVVYLGEPETGLEYPSLLLLEFETRKTTVLRPADNFMMPHQPSFSPDGNQVVFTLLGPTGSYPADICTVGSNGTGLRKLTRSIDYIDKPGYPIGPNIDKYWVGAAYQRYHYWARYSPDGSRILLRVYDVVGQVRDFTAVMNPDGSDLQILAEGRPAGWSADGKAVYYTHKGVLSRMELQTRAARAVPLPPAEKRTPLGRMKGRDWFAFRLGNGRIGWYDFETAAPVPQFLGEWSVPGFKMVGRERLELKGFDWSRSNEVLLWYQGEETERFEVIRIFDPTALSR